MARIKAAFFDIDNTLVDSKSGTMYPGLSELLSPEARPFSLTHITARNPLRYAEILQRHPAIYPSPDMPVGLEYGTKLIHAEDYADTRTYDVIAHQSFSAEEQAAIIDYVDYVPGYKRVAFSPQAPAGKRVLWTSDPDEAKAGNMRGGSTRLADLLSEHRPGLVACRIIEQLPSTALFPRALQAYRYDYSGSTTFDLLPHAANKSTAARTIMDRCGLQPEEVLIAGDGLPDLGMLSIAGVRAVLVGGRKTPSHLFPPHIARIAPDQHATYLAGLS